MDVSSGEWRPLISRLISEAEFGDPATDVEIQAAERELGIRFPNQLRSLLAESNGVSYGLTGQSGVRIPSIGHLIWPLPIIVAETERLRGGRASVVGGGMDVDYVLFAPAGRDGIVFGQAAAEAGVEHSDVVAWYPLEREIRYVADSLSRYLVGWLSGTLRI